MQSKRNTRPIILIRNIAEQHSWLQLWRSQGLSYIKYPVLDILPQPLKNFSQIVYEYDFFIFTSNHAVRIFQNQHTSILEKKEFQKKPKLCVGKFTADLLIQTGHSNVHIPDEGEGSDAIVAMFHKKGTFFGQKGIFLCGSSASFSLQKKLAMMNVEITRKELYKVVPVDSHDAGFVINCMLSDKYSYVLFCSGLSVEVFQKLFGSIICMRTLRIFCMGNSTKQALNGLKIYKYTYFSQQDNVAEKVLDELKAFE